MYNLKTDNHIYTIPASEHGVIYSCELSANQYPSNLPVRELSSDIQDLLVYLGQPPTQPLSGRGSKRICVTSQWAHDVMGGDHQKRMKVYDYLDANRHSTVRDSVRYVSYEAAIVLNHHGKTLTEFFNF